MPTQSRSGAVPSSPQPTIDHCFQIGGGTGEARQPGVILLQDSDPESPLELKHESHEVHRVDLYLVAQQPAPVQHGDIHLRGHPTQSVDDGALDNHFFLHLVSIRQLAAILKPESIALVGDGPIVALLARRLVRGHFKGRLMAVSQRRRVYRVESVRAPTDLPQAPDLAVICLPHGDLTETLTALASRGTRAVLLLRPDLPRVGDGGPEPDPVALAQTCRGPGLRWVGPTSFGLQVPTLGLNVSLAQCQARPGRITLVTQSGALANSALDWASERAIGLSHLVATGACTDVGSADLLDYLATDAATHAILLQIATVPDARRLLSAGRAAARLKPVIALVTGHCSATAPPSGRPMPVHRLEVWRAALQRVGIQCVDTLDALLDAGALLAMQRPPRGARISIVSKSKNAGRLAADALLARSGRLAGASDTTRSELVELLGSPPQPSNPLVIAIDNDAPLIQGVITTLARDPGVDATLWTQPPASRREGLRLAERLVEAATAANHPPVIAIWPQGATAAKARGQIAAAGIPVFETVERAVDALTTLARYHQCQDRLSQTPPPIPAGPADALRQAGSLVQEARSAGQERLQWPESANLLAAYGIPVAAAHGITPLPRLQAGASTLMAGATAEPTFGPVIWLGPAGVSAGRAVALPPLDLRLAHELVDRVGLQPSVALDALALTLVRLSDLVCSLPEVRSLVIEPLLIDDSGVLAVGAEVGLGETSDPPERRLAIRPYPIELEETIVLADGQRLLLRPIRPEDEPSLRQGFDLLTPEEVRMRFFGPMRGLNHTLAARLTQIDYERELALVLTDPGPAGLTAIYGVVRLIADPDGERAEFAIIVGHPFTGMGLGPFMMRRILDDARARGIREVYGEVLVENRPMLRLAEALGFTRRHLPDELGTVEISLRLDADG